MAGLFTCGPTWPFAPNGCGWVYELALGVKAGFLMSNASAGYYILVGALGTIGIALFAVYQPSSWDNNYNGKLKPNRHTWITLAVAGVLAITSVVSLVAIVGWENGKDFGKYYANSTCFLRQDVHDVPDSLKESGYDAQFDVDGCDLLGGGCSWLRQAGRTAVCRLGRSYQLARRCYAGHSSQDGWCAACQPG